MNHDTKVQILALGVMAGCLTGSGVLAVNLSAEQARSKLVYTTDANEGQPPQVALGIAMGAFRGVFVNWLWMRANDLKEEGRFHESVELAKAITILQPRFPRAWTFHAWNLAYNISVTTQTGLERWNWVRQGIDLLRGDARKYNPSDLHIHKELAWIFLHKIQGNTDDANMFYKKMLAKEWQIVLGPPPQFDPAMRTREGAVNKYVEWLTPIAEAPPTLDALYAGPDGDAVRDLVAKVKENGLRPDLDLETLGQYEFDRAVVNSGRRGRIEQTFKLGPKSLRFRELIEMPAYAKAWPRLLGFIRAQVLRDRYHMDPNVMIRYTKEYGPIDWRNPAAHALYWAAIGVEAALPRFEERNRKDYDFVNTDRIVVQAVQELYRYGTTYMDPVEIELDPMGPGYFRQLVNMNFIDTYGEIVEKVRERSQADDLNMHGYSPYSAGYENFLKDAIRHLYRRGDIASAEKYRKRLINYAGRNLNDPDRAQQLSVPLSEFVIKELWDRQTSPYVAQSEVSASLEGAVVALMNQDPEQFESQMRYAKDSYTFFRGKQERATSVAADVRMGIFGDPFELVAGEFFTNMLMMLPIERARITYQFAPDWLRQHAYEALTTNTNMAETLKTEDQTGNTFAKVFPEPTGMVEFRQRLAALRAERERNRPRTNTNLK